MQLYHCLDIAEIFFELAVQYTYLTSNSTCAYMGCIFFKHYENHKGGDILGGVSPVWVNFQEVSLHHNE